MAQEIKYFETESKECQGSRRSSAAFEMSIVIKKWMKENPSYNVISVSHSREEGANSEGCILRAFCSAIVLYDDNKG